MTAVLGCSPGTRAFAIAILIDNVLVDWDVLSFHGPWSKNKLSGILKRFETLLHTYEIQEVAIKIPDIFPTSINYNQLIGALNILLERKGMLVHYFTFSELKAHCDSNGKDAKECITNYVLHRHSELYTHIKSGRNLPNDRHFKVFEATCAAILLKYKRSNEAQSK